jgi:excisionase family DNA binding protein
MADDRWIGMKEITEHLGVSRETVVKWIENKKMPGHKLGKCWKFKKTEVDAWVKSGMGADAEVDEDKA